MADRCKRKTVLKDILKNDIKLEDAQENAGILRIVLEKLIDHMKEVDPLFKLLYNRIFYTGSYFEGLRVKNATEFDLNVVLVFPFKQKNDYEILTNCSPASFAKFHLTTNLEDLSTRNGWQEIKSTMRKFFDSDNYLLPAEVRKWFQGVVDKTLQPGKPSISSVSKIQRSMNGPAVTLYITTNNGIRLDVDLVPVVEFKWPSWPLNAKQHYTKLNIPKEERYWYIVPKPAPPELAGAKEKTDRLWRLHFPGIEQFLLYNRGCVKSVIKLMKLLRDRQNWVALASYYLKTVVMWSVINGKLDWNECNIDEHFVEMLKKLQTYVQERKLPYLFYPSYNLLYKLENNPLLANNIHGHLARIVRNIEKNPEEYIAILRA